LFSKLEKFSYKNNKNKKWVLLKILHGRQIENNTYNEYTHNKKKKPLLDIQETTTNKK
jgi:hypothetical protein